MTLGDRIQAVAASAARWRDPEHPARTSAAEATLAAPNRFTEESLAFALNHRAHQATEQALRTWTGDRAAERTVKVGVVCEESGPLAGWEAVLGAFLLGHAVLVAPPGASPALLPAFWSEVQGAADRVRVGTDTSDQEAVIAEGKNEATVAVIGGQEDSEALSGLAEDLLLHEGAAPGTPSVVWAPAGLEPDALLNALAGFRDFFPPHPDTDGTLALPAAFLASAKRSHAAGPGFLVSKGAPEPQGAAHVRWTEYKHLGDVTVWLRSQPHLSFLVAAPDVAERLATDLPVAAPGDVHRPALGQRNPDLIEFLVGL
ncbi:MAG: hypothetical protein AAGI91_10725 [Bacteroidota bacterium]